MNAFCGAVDYKSSRVDFELLKRMSAYFGKGNNINLTAGVISGCAIICAGSEADGSFQPLIRDCGGHEYMSAALIDGDSLQSAEGSYMAESLIEGYVGSGMSYLERLCAPMCAVIFNGAFGETVLISDRNSRGALYYTLRGSTMYFSSELRSLLSVIEVYEGSIKVDKDALRRHIMMPNEFFGESLFLGVHAIREGEGIIFSRFGISEFKTGGARESERGYGAFSGGVPICMGDGRNICASAEAMLDLFGYPQFDIYMPSLIERLERARASDGGRRRPMLESIPARAGLNERYLSGRASVIGKAYGVSVRSDICNRRDRSAQDSLYILRSKKLLEEALKRALCDGECVLYKLFDRKTLRSLSILKHEKNIPARVRLAGMLYQTVKWFERYNISF